MAQAYKVEHIDDELKKYPTLSFYARASSSTCGRGPHLPHAGKIGAFKILSIAGAYWKTTAPASSSSGYNATAFFSQKDLDTYLAIVEEAKKRDHRVARKAAEAVQPSARSSAPPHSVDAEGAIVPRYSWRPSSGRTDQQRLPAGAHPARRGLEMYRTSGHFPYYATPSPRCIAPAAGALDHANYRLGDGRAHEKREQRMQTYMKSAHFVPPEYVAAPTQEANWRAVHLFA